MHTTASLAPGRPESSSSFLPVGGRGAAPTVPHGGAEGEFMTMKPRSPIDPCPSHPPSFSLVLLHCQCATRSTVQTALPGPHHQSGVRLCEASPVVPTPLPLPPSSINP